MEIGSEFSGVFREQKCDAKADWLPYGGDHVFAFLGRTAIETVLRDIRCEKRKALLPSYCCVSMIEPFVAAGYAVSFYEVTMENCLTINLDIPDDCGVLLWCNYFGFDVPYPEMEIRRFQKNGGIVIEDITHSLLSKKQYHADSNYLVSSLRKWGPLLSGGFCSKHKGCFAEKPQVEPDTVFLNQKQEAMTLKEEYLQDHVAEKKTQYLQLFAESNQYIEEAYFGTLMDEFSLKLLGDWDIEHIRAIRKKNAEVLYQGLVSCERVRPLFSIEQMDCPLFVPIYVEKGLRDRLRKILIQEEIYCPVHWPQPDTGCRSVLYETELSLICDQRYSEKDMQRICQVVTHYF